jgi:peptidoglycan hydrolase CwlO-like protein
MNTPFTVTPLDLFNGALAICAAIVSVAAAMAVISSVIKKIKAPDTKQDERITKLEDEVKCIEGRLQQGNNRFQSDSERIDALERAFKQSNKVIIESLQALTAHALDQNSIGELHEARKRMDEYLRER